MFDFVFSFISRTSLRQRAPSVSSLNAACHRRSRTEASKIIFLYLLLIIPSDLSVPTSFSRGAPQTFHYRSRHHCSSPSPTVPKSRRMFLEVQHHLVHSYLPLSSQRRHSSTTLLFVVSVFSRLVHPLMMPSVMLLPKSTQVLYLPVSRR